MFTQNKAKVVGVLTKVEVFGAVEKFFEKSCISRFLYKEKQVYLALAKLTLPYLRPVSNSLATSQPTVPLSSILYTKDTWKQLIEINLVRASNLVLKTVRPPQQSIEQIDIFTNQKTQHISLHQRILVLSAFPLMLHEYYSVNLWQKL